MTNSFKIALLQLSVGKDKTKTVEYALNKIRDVVKESGAKVVGLPECFNCPYGAKYFSEYAEPVPNGWTCTQLSAIAKELAIYILGGSIPERSTDGKLYNTCTVWSPEGKLIGKHRKIHLYDIDLRPKMYFKESDSLTPGRDLTIVEIENQKVGISICHDVRFEEMARLYREAGCQMLYYPSAFDMTTGALHWELLHRSRANDLQLFVVCVSAARDVHADYVAWGGSMIVDPWGRVVKMAKEKEEVLVSIIDFRLVDEVRTQIPLNSQRRTDIYQTILIKK